MNPRILNRAGKLPDDGWYNIEATGEHVNHAAKVIQVIDAKAVESIVNRFTAEAAKAGENFAGMRVDKDHLSQSLENSTEAFGWNMQVRNRDGQLEAKIDWTSLGLPLVERKDDRPPAFKFFSTEYDSDECEKIGTRIVNRKSYAVVRPLRLDGLSLTNDPNNKGQRPISNRKSGDVPDREETKTMNTLLKKLGLAADASEESAVAALETINNRATKAESQVTALTTERDTLLASQVEADLEKHKAVIKNRDSVKKQLLANRASTLELLESMQAPTVTPTKITNRAGATPPAGERATHTGATEDDEKRRANKISNRASELKAAAPSRRFDDCWRQAQDETAEAEGKV